MHSSRVLPGACEQRLRQICAQSAARAGAAGSKNEAPAMRAMAKIGFTVRFPLLQSPPARLGRARREFMRGGGGYAGLSCG